MPRDLDPTLLQRWDDAKDALDQANAYYDRVYQEVVDAIGPVDDSTTITWNGTPFISYVKVESDRFDGKRFRLENPAIYRQYQKPSTSYQIRRVPTEDPHAR